ncbi:MAG: LapA family protein [Paracoccus sp. (in: a-proteobacteria)]|nr:LapA family protein [Paracoccus sp. (in: a-proteobacteria)]
MRIIRLIFVVFMALLLIGIALANRGAVTMRLFPANFDRYLGGAWEVTMPLFLIVLLAMLVGMLAGLVWEWLREAPIRSQAARAQEQCERLQREVGSLRDTHHAPKDEVLAILDAPKTPVAAPAPAATLPAPR